MKFSTLFYNLLVNLSWLRRRPRTAWLWDDLFVFSTKRFKDIVDTDIHGRNVRVNFGYPYPFIARLIGTFNNPLVELVYQKHVIEKRPVNMIDIGASIGDTVLLVSSNCPGMTGAIYCIEGEEGFFQLLEHNVRDFANVKIFRAMLSSESGLGRKLVRIHDGTASSVGKGKVKTLSLDTLTTREQIGEIDVLKIDVDGYDGRVLQGAKKFLRRNTPEVIFEWHPQLCRNAGNSTEMHFKILSQAGYSMFIFFTKFGEFSHFMVGYDKGAIAALAKYCVDPASRDDWHYDVIALHKKSRLDPTSLATVRYARNKPSPF